MFRRSVKLLPVVKSFSRLSHPVKIQSRSIWDLVRPTDFRHLIRDIDRQMDRFERDFFRRSPLRSLAPRFIPIDGKAIAEDSYRMNVDLQGYKPEDIKIALNDNILKIEAKMDFTTEDGSRIQQNLVREFTLPENVDVDSLKTLLHGDGVLSIEAPFAKLGEPKQIPIEQSSNQKSKL